MRALFLQAGPGTRAIVMMIIAMLVLSFMDAVAKDLTQRYHPLQVVWARFAGQAILSLIVFAPHLNSLLRTPYMGTQLVRSALLFSATIFFFFALSQLQLATVAAIFEVAPLMITAAAFFVLRESIGPRRWLGVLAGLIGAMIIIRPGSEVFSLATLLPLGAAASYTGYAISTRMLAREENPWTSFLYTALFGTLMASLIVPFFWQTPGLMDALQMLALGALASVGHLFLIHALTTGEASVIAPFGYFGLLFNVLWGIMLFGEIPAAATILGSLVIVGSGLYVWQRERPRKQDGKASLAGKPGNNRLKR